MQNSSQKKHTRIKILLRSFVFSCLYIVVGSSVALASKAQKPKQISQEQNSLKDHQIFTQANKLYNKGEYAKAIKKFQQLQRKDWKSFALYYNLGNCHFRLQELGTALGYYRRAQRIHPNNLQLLHNIQLLFRKLKRTATNQSSVRIKFIFWYYLLTIKQLYWIVVMMTFFCFLLWGFHIRRSSLGKSNLRWVLAGSLTLWLVFSGSLIVKFAQEKIQKHGVVKIESLTVRSGYGEHFEPLFQLTEADEINIKQKVSVTQEKGKKNQIWLRVEILLEDEKQNKKVNRSGWVPQASIFPI